MQKPGRTLYSYWRSSAAYRVRIALNLKRLDYEQIAIHLINNGGEQHAPEYHAINPQELVPTLLDAGHVIPQSQAILEYLDEAYPQTPPLLPAGAVARARVRGLASAVACDTHPLNNTRVLQYLETEWGIAPDARERWIRHWVSKGLGAIEELLAADAATGLFCHGDAPTQADVLLIPQLYVARRFSLDLAAYPTLRRIEKTCLDLEAFERARPENQADAPQP